MTQPKIDKETLEYLAQLARIQLDPAQEEKLLGDLQSILGHISELQSVDTTGVAPMNGGTALADVFRADGVANDGSAAPKSTNRGAGVEQFPDTKDDFLKIPPVFGGGSSFLQ